MEPDVVEKLLVEVLVKSEFAKKLQQEVNKELDKAGSMYGDNGILKRAVLEKLHEVARKLLTEAELSAQIEAKVRELMTKQVIELATAKTVEHILRALENQMRGY